MFYVTRTVLVELANYSESRLGGHRMERNNSIRNLLPFSRSTSNHLSTIVSFR
jgi:hypothetical protein